MNKLIHNSILVILSLAWLFALLVFIPKSSLAQTVIPCDPAFVTCPGVAATCPDLTEILNCCYDNGNGPIYACQYGPCHTSGACTTVNCTAEADPNGYCNGLLSQSLKDAGCHAECSQPTGDCVTICPPPCNSGIGCTSPCSGAPYNTCSSNDGTKTNCSYTSRTDSQPCMIVPAPNQPCTYDNCDFVNGYSCQSGSCVKNPPTPLCPNGVCDTGSGENCNTCWADCACSAGYTCQSGTCVSGGCTSCSCSCALPTNPCPPPGCGGGLCCAVCGDGKCDSYNGENNGNCCQDCGGCGGPVTCSNCSAGPSSGGRSNGCLCDLGQGECATSNCAAAPDGTNRCGGVVGTGSCAPSGGGGGTVTCSNCTGSSKGNGCFCTPGAGECALDFCKPNPNGQYTCGGYIGTGSCGGCPSGATCDPSVGNLPQGHCCQPYCGQCAPGLQCGSGTCQPAASGACENCSSGCGQRGDGCPCLVNGQRCGLCQYSMCNTTTGTCGGFVLACTPCTPDCSPYKAASVPCGQQVTDGCAYPPCPGVPADCGGICAGLKGTYCPIPSTCDTNTWQCIYPWVQTEEGDVHSNKNITTPGGP